MTHQVNNLYGWMDRLKSLTIIDNIIESKAVGNWKVLRPTYPLSFALYKHTLTIYSSIWTRPFCKIANITTFGKSLQSCPIKV